MSYIIREGVLTDLPILIEMGHRFLASTIYASFLTDNPAQMAITASHLMTSPDGVIFVAEDARHGVVGMIGMLLFSHFLSGDLTSSEIFWWVEPDQRGSMGVRLFKAAELWSVGHGAAVLQMVAPTIEVGALYERLGYRAIETAYQRKVCVV